MAKDFSAQKIQLNNIWQHKIEDNLDVVRAIGADTKIKELSCLLILLQKENPNTIEKYGKIIFGIHAHFSIDHNNGFQSDLRLLQIGLSKSTSALSSLREQRMNTNILSISLSRPRIKIHDQLRRKNNDARIYRAD